MERGAEEEILSVVSAKVWVEEAAPAADLAQVNKSNNNSSSASRSISVPTTW
jgi:hypothetical protein